MQENRQPVAIVIILVAMTATWAVTPKLRAAFDIASPTMQGGDVQSVMAVMGVGAVALFVAGCFAMLTLLTRAATPTRRERRITEPMYVVYR